MPTIIPTHRPFITVERSAALIAIAAVLCSAFLVAYGARAEPVDAAALACSDGSTPARSNAVTQTTGLELRLQ